MTKQYGMIGLPQARVMIKFDRLAGFVPTDADADFHVSALASANGEFAGNSEGVFFDLEGECFYRDIVWANRNNYLFQRGATIPASERLYADSNVEIETGRRTFIPIPRPGQENVVDGPNAFLSPADFATGDDAYPSNYDGPRWGLDKHSARNVAASQAGVTPQAQWLAVKKTKPGIEWAIRQSTPNFTNQPFWIQFNKAHALDSAAPPATTPPTDAGDKSVVYDPEEGSWLMIVLGGWTNNRDPLNSLSIVFPIEGYPYIIDNNIWVRLLDELGAEGVKDKTKRAEALSRAKVGYNSSEEWRLTNNSSHQNFQISFMVMRNRLFIRSSIASSTWIFPSSQTENPETGGHVRSDILQADRASSYSPGFQIPAVPIEIHGKGFSCSFNFNPMEFQQGPAFIVMPPITYSDASTGEYSGYGGMDQILSPWFSQSPANRQQGIVGLSPEELDQSPFALPCEDIRKKAYGFDYNPHTLVTTHGLGTDCIDWQVEPGFPKNFYGEEIEIAPGVIERGNSPTAKLMSVTKFRVNLISRKGVATRGGYEDSTSSAYRTPFFYRMKFKVRTNFVNKAPGIDITKNVLSIAHSTVAQNKSIITKEMTLTCLLPKQNDADYDDYSVTQRRSLTEQMSWGRLGRNPAIVRIWMGLGGSPDVPDELKANFFDPSDCYFTGITNPKSLEFSASRDTCTIQCVEFTKLLETMFYTSCPYFDGMKVSYAIAHVLERGGWSAMNGAPNGAVYKVTPEARAVGAMTRTLPDSGRWTQPIIKFNAGTSLMQCIKSFVERFQLVFRTSNTGAFLLDVPPGVRDIPDSNNPLGDIRFTPTNDLSVPTKYQFTSFPNDYNIHNQLKGKKVISPKNNAWFNVISIQTEDRFTSKMFVLQDGDPDSIVNPNAINFMGYMRQYFSRKSALGGKAETRNLINMQKKIMFQPIMLCTIQIPGRKDLKPLDLIKVDNNVYRVLDIRGNMSMTPPQWVMDVSAECIGYFKEDPDTSQLIYS